MILKIALSVEMSENRIVHWSVCFYSLNDVLTYGKRATQIFYKSQSIKR